MFLSSIQGHLKLDDPAIPQLQRVRDAYIMDLIMESGQFTAVQVRKLNYCRLYLNAVTLSDLSKINGLELDQSKLEGQPSIYSSVTRGPLIHQARPADTQWLLWQQANKLWSTASGQFHEPLGYWVVPREQQRQQHQAYWASDRIWVRIDC